MEINEDLFNKTSHSPALADLVGYEEAQYYVDYCFIANPYYPTQDMIDRLIAKLPSLIRAYPSSNPEVNNGYLAKVLRVNPDNLIIGNGATELITAICDELIESIGIPIPTFSEYHEKIERSKVQLYRVGPETDYQLDIDHYASWLQNHAVHAALLINPDNPTGQFFSIPQMQAFLDKASFLDLVIVDESFVDFAGDPVPSLLHSADIFSNLIIVRSMSKHCGVPGLRLGYCYTDNRYLLNRLRRRLPTWNINSVAEYYLSLLPETDADYHEARRRTIEDTQWLYHEIEGLPGFHVYPTGANFVLVRLENGMTAHELQMLLLKNYKLYVRDCSNKIGMDRYHIRIATQGREKDEPVVAALRELSQLPLEEIH